MAVGTGLLVVITILTINGFLKCQDLIVVTEKPFNAETSPNILCNDFITPTEKFFVRNHGDIPHIDVTKYRLVIDGLVKKISVFSLQKIKRLFPKHSIMATLMCAGNRRKELDRIKNIKGTPWDIGAISNAKWSGARLRDVLIKVGANMDSDFHVQFQGFDKPKDNITYSVSIPMIKASSLLGDVILAYEMNDKPLSPNHGAPLRVIVPGHIGARSCKWLKRISVKQTESNGYFQQKDYKFYQPQVGINDIDSWYQDVQAIQELNVQSAICTKDQQTTVEPFTVKGYALAGGGRKIIQVDVSLNGGSTWKLANLDPNMSSQNKGNIYWSWTLWNLTITEPLEGDYEITVRAWDSAVNSQPRNLEDIWNIRGVLNNAWHRVNISFKDTDY